MSYSSEVLADSPRFYGKLDEASGSTFADSATSGLGSGALTGTLAQYGVASDSGGSGVRFDTSAAHITVGSSSTMPSVATVEAWIYVTSLPGFSSGWAIYSCAASYGSTTTDKNLRLNDDGSLTWYCFTGSATALRTAASVITLNAWHHVVASIGALGMKIYVDKVQAATNGSTSSASYSGFGFIHGTGGFPDFNSSDAGPMRVSDVAFYDTQLSATRIAAHYDARGAGAAVSGVGNKAGISAAPVVVGGTGNSAGISAAPVVVSGVGDGAGVAASPVVTSGVGNSAGWNGSTEPPVEVSGIGNSAGIASAPVVEGGAGNSAGVSPSPVVVSGIGNRAGWAAGNGTALAETVDLGIGLGMSVSDQPVDFETETVDLGIALGLEANDVPIHGIETVDLGIRLGLRTFTPRAWGEDVRTGRPTPRVDVVRRDGTLVATLPKCTLKPLTTGINVIDRFGFTVERTSDRARLIEPVAHYARLWRGDVLMSKGPIGPGRSDASTTAYDCSDPRWFLTDERRVIGRIPKLQLLRNPGFTEGGNGLAFWAGGYDAGSNLAAGPDASVVADSYAASGKALQLGAADKVSTTKAVVETQAVFKGNRPYAWEPLLDGFLPGGTAAITAVANTMTGPSPTVHITGHTADADSGDGYELSLRRAQAARLVVLDRWPSATVTVEGKGETEPLVRGHNEEAYRKNRRVELEFGSTQTTVGHSRFYYQRGTITQPVGEKVPLPLVFAADMRIITWEGAPKNGYALLLRLTRGATVLDEVTATMDEFTPRVRWKGYSVSADVPADGIPTSWEVRLYPPAGASRWANVGLWPEEQVGLFDVDQALHVKRWVEHVQDETMGHLDLGIGTRTPLTGIPRTIERRFSERMPAGTQLDWYSSVDQGMDLDFDQDRDEIVTHYPRQGGPTDLVLIHGSRRSNVVSYKPLSTSSQALASNVIMQADGSGASRPEGYARDDAALGGTGLEAVLSAEEGTPLSELDEGAASALAASLRARPGWEVVIQADIIHTATGGIAWGGTTEFLERAGKGDTLRLVLPDEDVDGPHRIVLETWDPETDFVTVTLIEEV